MRSRRGHSSQHSTIIGSVNKEVEDRSYEINSTRLLSTKSGSVCIQSTSTESPCAQASMSAIVRPVVQTPYHCGCAIVLETKANKTSIHIVASFAVNWGPTEELKSQKYEVRSQKRETTIENEKRRKHILPPFACSAYAGTLVSASIASIHLKSCFISSTVVSAMWAMRKVCSLISP